MTLADFKKLTAMQRHELAEHLEELRRCKALKGLHPDEEKFLEELTKIESELGSLYPQ